MASLCDAIAGRGGLSYDIFLGKGVDVFRPSCACDPTSLICKLCAQNPFWAPPAAELLRYFPCSVSWARRPGRAEEQAGNAALCLCYWACVCSEGYVTDVTTRVVSVISLRLTIPR